MKQRVLLRCPDSPNCVSSRSGSTGHFVEPIGYSGSGEDAFDRLKETIVALPGTRILESDQFYLHAEFRTRWFRFKDDFEAILDEENRAIQIRSASRVGYWDLGANRRRVEKIRSLMERPPE